MGKHLREAYRHAQKIEYYYKHAGPAGYSQAVYHWDKIAELKHGAMRSKKDQSDAPIIYSILKSTQQMMDEMKKRGTDSNSNGKYKVYKI